MGRIAVLNDRQMLILDKASEYIYHKKASESSSVLPATHDVPPLAEASRLNIGRYILYRVHVIGIDTLLNNYSSVFFLFFFVLTMASRIKL